ncbi:MAG TPA: hypothetical protein VMV92_05745 [Streptosporangiaceae bacterium]|nr:hypothetical protein [Streptosporangiaceae bacterium]
MQANRASYHRRIDTAVVTPLLSLIDDIPLGFNSALASVSAMPRPPIGSFAIPVMLVTVIFGIVMFIATQQTLAPLIGGRLAGLGAGLLCGGEIIFFAAGWQLGVLVINDLIITVVVVGVTNLWTQTGMAPGHVAMLAVTLSGYDALATGLSGLTANFTRRVIGLPFAPLLATHYHPLPVFIGIGDCLLLTIWPLVAAKRYGRTAGWVAAAIDLLTVGPVLATMTRILGSSASVPMATPLGLLIVAQYLYWRRYARKPTAAESATARPHLADGLRTLDALGDLAPRPGTWVALHQGQIVATGTSPGTACQAARQAGLTAIPTTALVQSADLVPQ